MKTISEIRRERLEELISKFSSVRAFADFIEKSPAQVSQWRNASIDSKSGKPRGMGDSIARELEKKFEKSKGWMDSSHSDFQRDFVFQDVEEYSNAINLPLLNITASMGNGDNNHDEVVVDVLRVKKSWVDKTFSNISSVNNLSFIHAIGDSMMPTFNDGDILLVDSGVKDVTSDSVYVLEAHDRLFIKRVRRRIDGAFEISSDNPSVKTVDVLNGDHQVTIKGKVVWVWNGRKV